MILRPLFQWRPIGGGRMSRCDYTICLYLYFFGDTSHFYNVSSKEVLCTSWKAGDDIKNLYENLEKANKQAACPYDIGMSVGCAQFTKEVRAIPDLVNSADEDMYLRKEQKRTNL